MSIAGYFGRAGRPGPPRLRRDDGLGIEVEGPILAGEKTPEEVRAAETARVAGENREFYGRMAEYDPVLRSHCRF
jgi:hypothetical protein